MKRIALIVAGWISLLVGVAGLFLPVIQGWFFILLGLVLLSTEYVWAHHLLRKLFVRFPKVENAVHKSADRISKWLGIQPTA
ncbi:MAG: hypothetical protein JWO20_1960 [Candidatus Angelobacter sp.]|nr:hypothetical protein [Candidatus Angelobacter sp.]